MAAERTVAALLAAMFAWGCGSTESVPAKLVDSGASRGSCLVQFAGGQIEIVPLGGSSGLYRLPAEDGSQPLTWGRVSPDGAYVAARRAAVGGRKDSLVGVALDGRQLWGVESDFPGVPAISADSKKVAFSAGGRLNVYDVPTGELKPLPVNGQRPDWSPAGDRIAFDDGTSTRIYDLAREAVSDFAKGTEPSWFPGGESIAVRAGPDKVELVDLQGGTRRPLIVRDYASVPRWSANGDWMAYTYLGGARWWSIGQAASEPHQIVVRNTKTGVEGTAGVFYKANPGDYTWVTSDQLCRMAP